MANPTLKLEAVTLQTDQYGRWPAALRLQTMARSVWQVDMDGALSRYLPDAKIH